jgi:hypothetical protein
MSDYDSRYLAGVALFNEGEYFEAHEAWEDLWSESHGDDRRFYQGLIQAAVGLCHFVNGNLGGAVKLYQSAREYMSRCPDTMHGMSLPKFWGQMEACFAPLLGQDRPAPGASPDPELLPMISLDPQPAAWPEPGGLSPSGVEGAKDPGGRS